MHPFHYGGFFVRAATSRAASLAARLSALTGREAVIEELADLIHVRVPLPLRLSDLRRRSLLAVLADADRYGHDASEHGATVWVEVDDGGPAGYSNTSF